MKFQCQSAGSRQEVVQTDQRARHGPRQKVSTSPKHKILSIGVKNKQVKHYSFCVKVGRASTKKPFTYIVIFHDFRTVLGLFLSLVYKYQILKVNKLNLKQKVCNTVCAN